MRNEATGKFLPSQSSEMHCPCWAVSRHTLSCSQLPMKLVFLDPAFVDLAFASPLLGGSVFLPVASGAFA